MSATWHPRTLAALRPFVENYLRTGDPLQVTGGAAVALDSPAKLVDAYQRLAAFYGHQNDAVVRFGLLTALLENAPRALREVIDPTLDNGGAAIGFVLVNGAEHDFDKGVDGAAQFQDFLARRGLWAAGQESRAAFLQIGSATVTSVAQALQTPCADTNRDPIPLSPPWAVYMKKYGPLGHLGEIRTPQDLSQFPIGIACRAVYLAQEQVIRWVRDDTIAHIFRRAEHDMISRGDQLADPNAREGWITRYQGDGLYVR